MNNNRLF